MNASPTPPRLSGARIILGDQSPWAGGMLRWYAASQALDNEICYFIQDVDVPWVQCGSPDLRILRGWFSYYSMACKYHWTFCVPEARLLNIVDEKLE